VKEASADDRFFIYMFPKTRESIIERLSILEQIEGRDMTARRNYILNYAGRFKKINHTVEQRLEYFFQRLYFNNFKDRFIAFRKSDTLLKIVIVYFVLNGHLVFTSIILELNPFISFSELFVLYLKFSIILFPVSLLTAIMQLFFLGLFLSFVSLFDNSGKVRRMSTCVEEIVRSCKIGGRESVINLNDPDDFDY
jgi:hypothetical protein